MKKTKSGFTIVELLIVIVVIGILAAITVVAYNGFQQRSLAAKTVQDLKTINTAIQLYYADNGTYPPGWFTSSCSAPNSYISGLVPTYLAKFPTPTYTSDCRTSDYEAYLYASTGTDYKIMAHLGRYTTDLCSIVKASDSKMVNSNRDCWAFGFYSSGGTSL